MLKTTTVQEKDILYNNRKLVYLLGGSGKTVVLLHGFGEDGTIWHQQAAYLENHFQVLVPHLPGSADSEQLDDMSLENMAASLHFILEHEGIQECVMIGHSMGGYITLAFAEHYAHFLKGFGLFHSTAYADSAEKIATRQKGIQFLNAHGPNEFLKNTIPNLYSPATKEKAPALIEQHLHAVSYFSKAALISYYESMINRPDRTVILKQTALPVLFILGQYDIAVPLQDGLEQSHMPSLSYIHILDQSGHMGMVEEAEKTNTILMEYLSATL
jgi:pimeloyl-ACP methyl ester carboxylesterase